MSKKQIKILIGFSRNNDLYQDRGDSAIIETNDISILGPIKEKSEEKCVSSTPYGGPIFEETKVYYRWFYLKGNPESLIMYSKDKKDLDIPGWEDQKEEEKE